MRVHLTLKSKQDFVDSKVEVCEVCHKVTKCHILWESDNEIILVCGLCDAE